MHTRVNPAGVVVRCYRECSLSMGTRLRYLITRERGEGKHRFRHRFYRIRESAHRINTASFQSEKDKIEALTETYDLKHALAPDSTYADSQWVHLGAPKILNEGNAINQI